MNIVKDREKRCMPVDWSPKSAIICSVVIILIIITIIILIYDMTYYILYNVKHPAISVNSRKSTHDVFSSLLLLHLLQFDIFRLVCFIPGLSGGMFYFLHVSEKIYLHMTHTYLTIFFWFLLYSICWHRRRQQREKTATTKQSHHSIFTSQFQHWRRRLAFVQEKKNR